MTNEEFIKNVSLEGEEWRDVVGYEGLYMVSSFGRVVSLNRIVPSGMGGKIGRHKKPSIMSLTPNEHGYYICGLSKDGSVHKAKVHRLVGLAFINNPNNYDCIDHIDTNPKNNNISNLRWCTRKMNQNNPISLIKMSKSRKRVYEEGRVYTHPIVRISMNNENDVKFYNSLKSATKEGFTHQSISMCCLKQRRMHKGYKWMYLSDYETLINKSKNDSCQPGK